MSIQASGSTSWCFESQPAPVSRIVPSYSVGQGSPPAALSTVTEHPNGYGIGFRLGPRLGALVLAVATVPGPARDPLAVRPWSQYAVTNIILVVHFNPL